LACNRAPIAVPREPDRIAIVVAERGTHGVHLIAIDEAGDRMLEVVQPTAGLGRDTNPAISPDGKWIVFARGRGSGATIDETKLWIAPVAPEAIAAPLTAAAGIETNPTWTRDGSAIVFASTGSGANYDLYEQSIANGRASGAAIRLTSSPAHEVTPSVAADGTIVYAALTTGSDGAVESHLDARAPDGAIAKLTDGPLDAAPAISPDGTRIAFARLVVHRTLRDGDLFVMPRGGSATDAHVLVDLPLTDESGPVWSRDGRFVLATSLLRGATGDVVFASVIEVDTRAATPIARILVDRTGAVPRFTPAIASAALDGSALDRDPEYLPELARITAQAIVDAGSALQ
jgi:Tol biopolymer transport system component